MVRGRGLGAQMMNCDHVWLQADFEQVGVFEKQRNE